MFSLLFLNKSNSELLTKKSADDLELKEIFNANTLGVITQKCSSEEIGARQTFFKCMDDDTFFANLYNFYLNLKSSMRNMKNLESVTNPVEYYFCFLNYAKEYKKTIQSSGFLILENLALVENFKEELESAIASVKELEQSIFEFENLICKFKKMVLTYSANIDSFKREKDICSQLSYIAQEMGLDIVSNRKSQNRRIPKHISDNIIIKEDGELLENYVKQIKSHFNEEIYSLIPYLAFYFDIHSLKKKAYEYKIPSCYATISEEPCFIADNIFNITLLDTIKDKIVPNDAFFTNESNFFVLTGANSGGKTSYLKAIAVNLLLFLSGCPIFCSNAKIYPFSKIFTHFCPNEKNTKNGSFNDEYQDLKSLADIINDFDSCFVLLNEPLTTTDSFKAETLIYEFADSFYKKGVFGLLITHFILLQIWVFPLCMLLSTVIICVHIKSKLAANQVHMPLIYCKNISWIINL